VFFFFFLRGILFYYRAFKHFDDELGMYER